MNKRDANKFRKLLLKEGGKLSDGLKKLEADTLYQPASDNVADLSSCAEVGTDSFERETALNIACGENERLRDVADALQRINSGSYGGCEGCECEIPRKRLEVFPAARYCIECQSKLERDGVL
jgi:RNA polymerase-binding protein DksA